MLHNRLLPTIVLLTVVLGVAGSSLVRAQQKEYLTSIEADRIRDAETSNDRIKLFIAFAADRLKKFEYELGRVASDRRRAERLNGLLNAYMGCVDDAAELIGVGLERQEDIRGGIKEMQKKGKEFLASLEHVAASGQEIDPFKDTLDDAVQATKEALAEAERAAKEIAPPPVRRRP